MGTPKNQILQFGRAKGVDSPPPSRFLPLHMHRAMHAWVRGAQGHPYENTHAHRPAHTDSCTGMDTLSHIAHTYADTPAET